MDYCPNCKSTKIREDTELGFYVCIECDSEVEFEDDKFERDYYHEWVDDQLSD